MEVTGPRPMDGIRAVAFYARTHELRGETTLTVARSALKWIEENPRACVLRIEFDQWDTPPSGATAAERLLNSIFPKGSEDAPIWNASAVVYYDAMEDTPLPPPLEWKEV